jgi:hypothetical protein
MFHPDNRLFALITGDHASDPTGRLLGTPQLRFIDGTTGLEVSQFKIEPSWESWTMGPPLRFMADGTCVALQKDSSYLAAGYDGWKGTSQTLMSFPNQESLWPRIGPDGRTVVVPTRSPRCEVHDLKTGELRSVFFTTMSSHVDGTFSPDAKLMVTATNDLGGFQIWNLADGTRTATVTGYEGTVEWARFDTSGQRVLFRVRDDRKVARRTQMIVFDIATSTLSPDARIPKEGTFELIDECDEWRIDRHYSNDGMSTLLIYDPHDRVVFSLCEQLSSDPFEDCEFVRGTELVSLRWDRRPSDTRQFYDKIPWIGQFLVRKLGENENDAVYRIMCRNTGKTIWESNWRERFGRGFDWRRKYSISSNGKRLAEMIQDDKHTTITVRFWTLPVRRWHRWVAGVLGIVAAGWTWWFGGRSRAVVSDSARDQV